MKDQQGIELALAHGAYKAAYLTASDIVLTAECRTLCAANQCGLYGKCWVCPPAVGEIDTLMATVQSFPRGLLYQTVGTLTDSYDFEGMVSAKQRHTRISYAIEDAIAPLFTQPHLHLSGGGCSLCDTCALVDNRPCRFPDKALSSLEAYGIDVYHTAKNTPLAYINGANTVTYFGLVLFSE